MCVVCVPLLSELLEEVCWYKSCVVRNVVPAYCMQQTGYFWSHAQLSLSISLTVSCTCLFCFFSIAHIYYIVDLTSLRFLQDYAKRNFMLACFKAWMSSTTLYTTKIHLYSEKIVWIFSSRLDFITRIHLLKNFVILWERKGHMWRGSVVSIFL